MIFKKTKLKVFKKKFDPVFAEYYKMILMQTKDKQKADKIMHLFIMDALKGFNLFRLIYFEKWLSKVCTRGLHSYYNKIDGVIDIVKKF